MKAFITIKFALLFSIINGALYAQTNNFEFDFDKYDGSYKTYTNPLLEADFDKTTLTAVTDVDERGTVGRKQLRAFYPKNKISGKETGFRFEKFMTQSNEAVLEYRVKFEEGFDFSKGGKLPGLAGSETGRGRGVYGCNDDRNQRKKAFSTRLMWRANGRLIYYAYAPLHKDYVDHSNDIPNDARKKGQGRCGGDLTIDTLKVNRWYKIKQYIKLNTVTNGNPNKNGIVKVWINDVLEFQSNDFVLAGTTRVKANSIAFHTYRGGSTDDWASSEDGYAVFDDIKACTGCKDVPDSGDSSTNQAPVVSITSPRNNTTHIIGQNITIQANASDPNGNFDKVKFYVDDTFIKQDSDAPYAYTYTPTTVGTKIIKVEGLDKDGLKTERTVTINVVQENVAPIVNLTSPVDGAIYEIGETIALEATSSDADGTIEKTNFKINDLFYRFSTANPAKTIFDPTAVGTYKIAARTVDNDGLDNEKFVTITVVEPNRAPTVNLTSPVDGAVYQLNETITIAAVANDIDGNFKNVNFKIDDQFYRFSGQQEASTVFNPTVAGTYKIAARAIDTEGLAEEKFVTITVAEPTLSNESFLNNETADKITMYPNPAVEVIHIKGAKTGTNYQIMDLSGKVMYTGKTENADAVMDISKYAKGVYFIKLTDGNHSKTRTFLKN